MTEYRDSDDDPKQVGKVGNPTSPTSSSEEVPRIIDAVSDDHGNKHYRFGTNTRSVWFSLADFIRDERATFVQLQSVQPLVTSNARRKFKELVQAHNEFRTGRVANEPGWWGNSFVLGNGKVVSPPGSTDEIVVTFAPQAKFAERGTLKEWKKALGPTVKNEPIVLAVLSHAFSGALLPHLPPDFISPMIELVGERERGKTTLALLAASVWAGRPGESIGGAESWKSTLAGFEATRARHRHSLLVLDEANLAGTDGKKAGALIGDAIMSLVAPQQKTRHGDPGNVLPIQLAILSTSNRRLRDLIAVDPAVLDALESRLLAIKLPNWGILTRLNGPRKRGAAVERLHQLTALQYGTAGCRFVQYLVEQLAKNEGEMRHSLDADLKEIRAKLAKVGTARSSRHIKIFCLMMLSARIAAISGAMSASWRAESAILRLYRSQIASEKRMGRSAAIDQIETYRREHRLIIPGVKRHYPAKCDVNAVDGFERASASIIEVMIGVERFRRTFPDYKVLLALLKAQGLLKTEQGKHPKLSIKAPSAFATKGRVYCIRLPAPQPS